MLYKEDWQTAQERLQAWWDREIIDRACIQVTAPACRRCSPRDSGSRHRRTAVDRPGLCG